MPPTPLPWALFDMVTKHRGTSTPSRLEPSRPLNYLLGSSAPSQNPQSSSYEDRLVEDIQVHLSLSPSSVREVAVTLSPKKTPHDGQATRAMATPNSTSTHSATSRIPPPVVSEVLAQHICDQIESLSPRYKFFIFSLGLRISQQSVSGFVVDPGNCFRINTTQDTPHQRQQSRPISTSHSHGLLTSLASEASFLRMLYILTTLNDTEVAFKLAINLNPLPMLLKAVPTMSAVT